MSALRRDRDRQRRGRRHARPPPRPVGQADPAARARRLAPARAAELARRSDVFVDNRYVSPDTWYDERRQGVPAAGPLLRRRRDEALRRGAVPAARGGLRRAAPPRRHLARVAHRLRRDGAVLHARPSSSTRCTARAARTRPSRRRARRTRSRPSATSPASSSSPTTSRRPATTRSTRPAACMLDERRHAPQRVRALRDVRRLPMPGAREVRRRGARRAPGARAPERHAADERRGGAASRPTTPGPTVTGVVVDRDGATGDLPGRHRRRLLRRGEQRQAAARLGDRRAPERPRQRLRPGRAQLHVPQQPGGARALEGAEPDGVPEDARAQRLLLRAPTRSTTRSATSRWSASRRRRCTAARSRCRRGSRRSGRSRDVAGHAVDFWLSTEDLPRPENRVTPATATGSVPLALHGDQRRAQEALLHELKAMLGHLGMHHDHLVPRHAYLKNEIPVAGCAHQAGTCRFGTRSRDARCSNTDCRAHEVDNLYVVDTSFFPSIGAVNPALTAMANALRVGDHLLERLGAPQTRPERRPCRLSATHGTAPRRHRRRRLRRASAARGGSPSTTTST